MDDQSWHRYYVFIRRHIVSMQQTPSIYPATKARRPYRVGFVTFLFVPLLALATGLIQFHLQAVYQTYQQGFCTIESGTTEYHSTKNSHYYTPEFQYTIYTKDGQQDEAQQVVDSYNVGASYQCWYNPASPDHAVLVYYGFSTTYLIGSYIATALISLMGYTALWYLLYYMFYRQLCLIRRGVLTMGQVDSQFERRSRYGRKTYSRIFFSPVDDPSQRSKLEIPGAYVVGSLEPVCYDPRNPKNAQHGKRPGSGCAIFALMGFIVGVLIAGLLLLNVWYGA